MAQPAAPHALATLVSRLSETAELEDAARQLADPSRGPREFLGTLHEAEMHVDAVKFLAFLLPQREAVWWAWMCARKQTPAEPPAELGDALEATERWIAEPTEENRRAAMEAAQVATFETGAGCAALAAFLSGGTLAPPGAEPVPPPPFAAARAVFGSLVLSAVATEPERAPERFDRFLSYGLELAERIRLWESIERGP